MKEEVIKEDRDKKLEEKPSGREWRSGEKQKKRMNKEEIKGDREKSQRKSEADKREKDRERSEKYTGAVGERQERQEEQRVKGEIFLTKVDMKTVQNIY